MTILGAVEVVLSAPPAGAGADDDATVDLVLTHADRNAEFTAFMREAHASLHRMAYLLCGDPHWADETSSPTRAPRHPWAYGRSRIATPSSGRC